MIIISKFISELKRDKDLLRYLISGERVLFEGIIFALDKGQLTTTNKFGENL